MNTKCIHLHTHLLFEFLIHSCHACCAVFFVGFHFLVKLLLCHLAEVVVLLHCFLKDLLLMLSFLSQMLQDLCLMVLIWGTNEEQMRNRMQDKHAIQCQTTSYLASLLCCIQFFLDLIQRYLLLLGGGKWEFSLGIWSRGTQDDFKGLSWGTLVQFLNLKVC